jgi:hypothetical protein
MIKEVVSLKKRIELKYPEEFSCWCEHFTNEEVRVQDTDEQVEKDDSTSTKEILLFFHSFVKNESNTKG